MEVDWYLGISDCTFGVFYTKVWGVSDPSRHRILPFCSLQHDSIYWTELHFVSISVLETALLPSLDCSSVRTRSSTPSSLYQIFSCRLLLCPEFYAQSTAFNFFLTWCKNYLCCRDRAGGGAGGALAPPLFWLLMLEHWMFNWKYLRCWWRTENLPVLMTF